eukprot:5223335-Amphidinium_carterae.1
MHFRLSCPSKTCALLGLSRMEEDFMTWLCMLTKTMTWQHVNEEKTPSDTSSQSQNGTALLVQKRV